MRALNGFSAVLLAGSLTACGSHDMYSDMRHNDFPNIRAVAPPAAMVGTWTGSMGPYLATLRLEPSGSGLLCSSWNGRDTVARAKYDGQQIRAQDGSRLDVVRIDSDAMEVSAPYYGGADYMLRRDDALGEAAIYCAQQLK
ncbi:J517_1871 family lipoprotein [Stutzerimonas stutzeri]|uniref:J517_1871 family lipoprotein n=1 Tax=Stutzerimonas stutzeri TaxID=316 RepID=UPI00210B86CB|nr:J517_1871 family lipoprotein [Stutzerimonas stutzeri]MCQ4257477.1 hypothetical protein [Stutzerimonas stutzeri]